MGPKLCDVHGGMFHFKMQMYSTNYSYLEDIDSPHNNLNMRIIMQYALKQSSLTYNGLVHTYNEIIGMNMLIQLSIY